MIANPVNLVILFPTRALPLFIVMLFAATAVAEESCPPPYSYCGFTGPAQWPNIAITGKENECAGTRQSPIDLPTLPLTPGPLIEVKYVSGKATIANTGHDIEVTPAENKSTLTIGKDVYSLVKFHFHVRSEHRIQGQDQPGEIHFVHSRVEGEKTSYAVIGVLLRAGAEYPGLKPVFAKLPKKVCDKVTDVAIDFNELLPAKLGHCYTYAGSLTTPPCSQIVTWYVLAAPRTILDADLKSLTALGSNARPIQVNQPSLPVAFVRPQ